VTADPDSDLDPIVKFDMDGSPAASCGAGLFIWPHVDREGNVWATGSVSPSRIP